MHGMAPSKGGRGVPAPLTVLDTAMRKTHFGDKTSTKQCTAAKSLASDDGGLDATFWDMIQDELIETESRQVSGRFEIGINGRAYPMTDCERDTIVGVEALGVILVASDIPDPLFVSEGGPLRVDIRGLTLITSVAQIDVNGPIITVWLTDADLISRFNGDTPQGWHLEERTTAVQSGKQILIGNQKTDMQ